MKEIKYYSTNNHSLQVSFEQALLTGQPEDYGLYMVAKNDLPKFSLRQMASMQKMSYADIAFRVLRPFLLDIPQKKLEALINDAYREDIIPTRVQHITGKTYILWLTNGPTYSFKDYAARFFGRVLNYCLSKRKTKRTVVVATSGDTGGAIAQALHGLEHVGVIIFYPYGSISEGQRKQMTTLGGNIWAFAVNGDFDICQALAKFLLGDKAFAQEAYGDMQRITSANSISIGRLLPQAVYPFFAYSRILHHGEPMIASIPSGNFGDMMGTVLAKAMGLPVSKIICGVNENTEFPGFLRTGKYIVNPSKKSPSSAMVVSHPSNLARLVDFYNGHLFDERDPVTKKVMREGIIDHMPDMAALRRDIVSVSVSNKDHYQTMQHAYEMYNIILDPHGAVGWKALEMITHGRHDALSVVYETADPGKFPEDVFKAIGTYPELPEGVKHQKQQKERIYTIESAPDAQGSTMKLSSAQIAEAKEKIREIATAKTG